MSHLMVLSRTKLMYTEHMQLRQHSRPWGIKSSRKAQLRFVEGKLQRWLSGVTLGLIHLTFVQRARLPSLTPETIQKRKQSRQPWVSKDMPLSVTFSLSNLNQQSASPISVVILLLTKTHIPEQQLLGLTLVWDNQILKLRVGPFPS